MTRRHTAIAIFAVLAAVTTGCGGDEKSAASGSGSASKPGGSGSGSTVSESAPAGPADVSYVVTGTDFKFGLPADFTIKAGQKVNLTLDNQGKEPHELELFDPSGTALGEIEPVDAGKKDAATFDIKTAGTYKLVCGIEGHEAKGMVTTVTVA